MSALIFVDSFDHYSTAQSSRKWNSGPTIVAGRTGSGGSTGGGIVRTFGQTYFSFTLGVAFKFSDYSGIPVQFKYHDAPSGGNTEFWLTHNDDGRFYFRHERPGGDVATSPVTTFVAATGQWYYFEVQAAVTPGPPGHLDASLRINGAVALTWSDDYTPTGLPFNRIDLWISGAIDDLYLTDTEFLGDVRVGVLYPNAAGDSSAWTPNAGTNWSQVEEHPADDDTSYVSAATVSLKELYNLDDIDPAFTGVVKGVQALWCVKKSDEGQGAVKGVWKSGVTEITQSAGHNYLAPDGYHPSAASYVYNIQTERVSLFTATDWTKTEINALQLGITRTV